MSDNEYEEMLTGAKRIADTLDKLAGLAAVTDADELAELFPPDDADTDRAHADLSREAVEAALLTEPEGSDYLRITAAAVEDMTRPMWCPTCRTNWDDAVSTSLTPTPAGRCPFEYQHADRDDAEAEAARRLAIAFLEEHGQTPDPDADADALAEAAREALDEYGLDFYVTGEKRGGEWSATGWVYVVTTGGPHYELRDDGYVHGWGWFGADRVRASVSDAVTAHFESWADQ